MLKIVCNCTSSNICCRSRDCYIHYIYKINLLWIKDSNFVWSWYESLIWCWGSKKNNLIFYWWAWQLPRHIFSPVCFGNLQVIKSASSSSFFFFSETNRQEKRKRGRPRRRRWRFLMFFLGGSVCGFS